MLYNPSGHPIHIYAKKLLEDFEQSLSDLVSERLGEMLLQFIDVDSNLESYPLTTLGSENSTKLSSSGTVTTAVAASSSSSSSSSQNSTSEVNQDTPRLARHVSFIESDSKKEFDENNRHNQHHHHHSYELGEGVDINASMIQITPSTPNNDSTKEINGFFECDGKNDDLDENDLGPKLLRQDSTDSCLSLNDSWSRRPDHTNSQVCTSSDIRVQNNRKLFEKSQLGQKGVLTLMSELSRNVYRLKDDMYVITFNDSTSTSSTIISTSSSSLPSSSSSSASSDSIIKKDNDSELSNKIIESSSSRGGKGRGKGLSVMVVSSTPSSSTNQSDQNLTTISSNCFEYLKYIDQSLSIAANDPDNEFYCPFIDSRQTFLEICQYRHFQFDTLRRAKHSSIMLIYHLLYPYNQFTRPKCSMCNNLIQYVLWHCTECNLYWKTNHMNQSDMLTSNVCCHDICNDCYVKMKTDSNCNHHLHHELTHVRLTFS